MAQSSFFRRPPVMLALALASVSIVVTLMGRIAGGPATQDQKRVQVSGGAGFESYPSLSPDGKRAAYSGHEAVKKGVWHIYVRELPSGAPKQLTQGEENDVAPVWSPDGGTLAFQRIGDSKVEYIVIPADGGAERKVTEFSPAPRTDNPLPAVAWLPDGSTLIVVQPVQDKPAALASVSLSSGKVERITNPPDDSGGDFTPAVSPAGDSLAFVRTTTKDGADVWVSDLKGANLRQLTFDDVAVRGLNWARDGQDLFYSAHRMDGWHVWRVSSGGGSPRDISIAGDSAYFPAIGRNRLAYVNSPTVAAIWRSKIGGGEGEHEERMMVRSGGRESDPAYSPDGTKIVSVGDESGNEEIYLQDASGGNRFQLTHMKRPRIGRVAWSPDSKSLIFDIRTDNGPEIWVTGALAGAQPARVVSRASEGSFSRDGKSIYYQMKSQIWRAAANGSNPQLLTPESRGASNAVESFDGQYVIFRMHRSIWRMPVAGGEPEEFIEPEQELYWTTLQPVKNGVYYLIWDRGDRGSGVAFYDYAEKKSSVLTRSGGFDHNASTFSVSPDGKYMLYPKVDRSQTNLVFVDNFK